MISNFLKASNKVERYVLVLKSYQTTATHAVKMNMLYRAHVVLLQQITDELHTLTKHCNTSSDCHKIMNERENQQ